MRYALFYPEIPRRSNKLFHWLQKWNIRSEVFRPGAFQDVPEFRMFWSFQAYTPPGDSDLLHFLDSGEVLNSGAVDVLKSTVDRVFAEIFGYSALLSEAIILGGSGVCVRKSEEQCRHDGKILRLPLAALSPGYVYMKLIDTRISNEHLLDLRVPVIAGNIPYVLLKRRPLDNIFKLRGWSGEVADPKKIFSLIEIGKVKEFTRRLDLQYCELDILRDSDGRSYIVDVNPTPGTMPKAGVTDRDFAGMDQEMRRLFHTSFIS